MPNPMTRPDSKARADVVTPPAECPVNSIRGGRWLKRIGAAAFLFYLIKGLIWLGVLAAGGAGLISLGN